MKLFFLDPVYAHPGPYACAYLDTSTDIDDPQKAVELRWRHLRDALRAQGADTGTVAAVGAVVGSDQEVPGRHGQAISAAHERLALVEELPEPPARDTARCAPLPDTMPLAVAHAPDVEYVAVLVTRGVREAAGELATFIDVDVETGRWPMSAVAPGLRCRWQLPVGDWRHRVRHDAVTMADIRSPTTRGEEGEEAGSRSD